MIKSIFIKLVLIYFFLNISQQIEQEDGERLEIVKQKLKYLKEGVIDLSSNYNIPARIDGDITRLVFIHSTDVHGHMKPSLYTTLDTDEDYEVGGLGRVSSVMDIIR